MTSLADEPRCDEPDRLRAQPSPVIVRGQEEIDAGVTEGCAELLGGLDHPCDLPVDLHRPVDLVVIRYPLLDRRAVMWPPPPCDRG